MAVCAWEVTVVGSLLTTFALSGTHIWGKDDYVWPMELAICGLVVVGVIALLSRRFGKLGGAITGLLGGFLPSVLMLTWVLVARSGFEASAAGAGSHSGWLLQAASEGCWQESFAQRERRYL